MSVSHITGAENCLKYVTIGLLSFVIKSLIIKLSFFFFKMNLYSLNLLESEKTAILIGIINVLPLLSTWEKTFELL